MPNKYSHGLVFSQQQRWAIIDSDPPSSSSLKPPSSPNPKSHTRSAESSISSYSGYSAQHAVIADYIGFEPDIEQESSSASKSPPPISRPSFTSTPSDVPQVEPRSPNPSRPPSDRLRLESPSGLRIENLPSPPPRSSERPHYDLSPSHHPDVESSSQGRIRLVDPSSLSTRNTRPLLHHKNSSVETQIYAPRRTIQPASAQEAQGLFSVEPSQPHFTPPAKHERQYVCSTDSPKTSRPPTSRELSSSEIRRTYSSSPTRDSRQSFAQKTHTLASPQPVRVGLSTSPFGTDNPSLSPIARDFQDYFSSRTHGSQAISAATRDRQKNARSPFHTPPQNGQDRPSMDLHRLHSPPQTQEHRQRPYFEKRHFSPKNQSSTTLQSFHGRRPSIDLQPTFGHQDPRSLGPRRLSFDQSIKPALHSRNQSNSSEIAQNSRPLPFSNSQQLSWEQFVHESENIREPLIDSQTYSSRMLSSYTRRPDSRQDSLADAQRYTPKNPSLGNTPRPHRDRRSKLPDTFASQHRILLPTGPGTYENVSIETHGFPPQRPPSPPVTPNSDKSFSLTPQVAESQRTKPSPPNPQRSTERSLSRQRSILRSNRPLAGDCPSEPPRPKTSSAVDGSTLSRKAASLHSPTFSISTRSSSINATRSPQSVSFSNFSDAMTSPRRVPLGHSRDRGYFDDADLSPLPSEIDFNVLPYEDPNIGPAIFRPTQLRLENPTSPRYEDPISRPTVLRATQLGLPTSPDEAAPSRTSSFDSAAPPPIGMNRHTSQRTAKSHQPKTPKKEGKTSLLSFLRSTPAPKAVLYSEAPQGKPPVSVSVSRTGIPSIPSLFPGYRGQFPPRSQQRTRDTGSKSSLEPRPRAPRSPAHLDAAEKRKSWVKGDDVIVDRSHRASHLEKQREFERILKAI